MSRDVLDQPTIGASLILRMQEQRDAARSEAAKYRKLHQLATRVMPWMLFGGMLAGFMVAVVILWLAVGVPKVVCQ